MVTVYILMAVKTYGFDNLLKTGIQNKNQKVHKNLV